MFLSLVLLGVKVSLLTDGGQHGSALEAVPHNVDSQRRGVRHLLVEEAVVAQLVKDNLV